MAEDEMVGWHHRLNGHEFEQAPGDSEGQESLACCSLWSCKESDTAEELNNNNALFRFPFLPSILFLFQHPIQDIHHILASLDMTV